MPFKQKRIMSHTQARATIKGERKRNIQDMAKVRAIELFKYVGHGNITSDLVEKYGKEIRKLAKKHPLAILDIATKSLDTKLHRPTIQTYVLASEVFIQSGRKLSKEAKASLSEKFLNIVEHPMVVNRHSLISINADYLGTIVEGTYSLLRASDRRFLRYVQSNEYRQKRKTAIGNLNSLVKNPTYKSGKGKRVSKYAKKIVNILD